MHEHCRWLRSLRASIFVPTVLLASGMASASDWSVSVAASSNYVVHGLTRSQNEAVLQAHVGWTGDQRWSFGVWASTVDYFSGPGPQQEYDLYLARVWPLGRDWRLTGQITRYESRGDGAYLTYDYTEWAASLSFRDALALSVTHSPDYSAYSSRGIANERRVIGYELTGRLPINRYLQLTAAVGRMDLEDLFGASYWHWSGGGELALRRVSLGLTYIGADAVAGQLFGRRAAADTWMASIAVRLH